ncbi:MAG: SPOR domain-containing protein [bacterium]|nr:SPOR domain-containing protein [bacterium]
MLKRICILFAIIALMAGCTAKQQTTTDPWQDEAAEEQYSADKDTLTYNFLAESEPEVSPPAEEAADLPVIEEEQSTAAVITPPVAEPAEETIEVVPQIEEGPLYWVQIFASNSRKSAEEVALEADNKIEERVRILFLEPYYKVLVGGFPLKDTAVELRRELTQIGYKDAWIFQK